jgi:hypothetical protein
LHKGILPKGLEELIFSYRFFACLRQELIPR